MSSPDPLHIGLSKGPVTNTATEEWVLPWDRLLDRLARPKVGPKDGSYLLRGPCSPSRSDANLSWAWLAIYDGDHRVDAQTGEELDAPPPVEVAAVLRDAGLRFALATTHSHGAKGVRWRLFLPVSRPYARHECEAVTRAVWVRLHREVGLAWSKESAVWSQAFFLPRIARPGSPFEFHESDGEPLDVDRCAAWWARREAKERQRRTRDAVLQSPGGRALDAAYGGRIEEFNRSHRIGDLVTQAGYQARGHRTLADGTQAELYIRPGSESGVPGLVVFRSDRFDKEIAVSHSGACPLSGRPFVDAYEVAGLLGVGS